MSTQKQPGIQLNLKQKLFIGFGFFFLMVVMLGGLGIYFVFDLEQRSSNMLKENYQTVEATTKLMGELDELRIFHTAVFLGQVAPPNDLATYGAKKSSIDQLRTSIRNNITEVGERELVEALDKAFEDYHSAFETARKDGRREPAFFFGDILPRYQKTRDLVLAITRLNMAAIVHKNSLLKNTAKKAFGIISVISTVCFAVSMFFFFRYPHKIVNPIRQLIVAIKDISLKNYEKRLTVTSKDELQQLAEEFNMMASRLDEYEHSNLSKLVFEKKRIDTIINKMQDAIIGLDEGREIIFCNELACQMLKTPNAELVGKKVSVLAGLIPQLALVTNGLDDGDADKPDKVPIKLYIDNKATFFTREVINVEVPRSDFEQPTRGGCVVVLKNVTKFLEQAQAKTDFIATVSHELKTPLASLKLNLKLLEDKRVGELNDEQRHIVSNIKFETDKMRNISSELLDMAQIESGSIKLNIQKVWPEQIVEYARETILNQPPTSVRVHFDLQTGLPMLFCDPEKTAWVLINLINNAMKYNESSQSVYVMVVREEQTIRFTVQDFGAGIAPSYIDKIFDKFFRIPGTTQEGRGLGLSISKEFITKQNGRIWAESEVGFGSKFNFALPVAII